VKRNKYRNIKTEVDGLRFDSMAEGRRYASLRLLERAGEISDLRRQVPFELLPSVKYEGSARATGPTKYLADFAYTDKSGKQIIEDCKGMETDIFRLKRKMMLVLLGLEITLSK